MKNSSESIKDIDDLSLVSHKIRSRLKEENVSFFANDNISEFIEPGELD